MLKKNKKTKSKKNKKQKDNLTVVGTVGNRDLIYPDAFIEREDYMYLGFERYVRTMGITVISSTYVGMFDPVFKELGMFIDSTSYISRINNRDAINELMHEIGVVGSNERLAEKRGTRDYAAMKMRESLEEMQMLIQTDQERLFYVRKYFKIWGRSKEDLDYNTNVFLTKIEGMSIDARPFVLNQAVSFLSTLPSSYIMKTDKQFKRNFTTAGIAGMLPTGYNGVNHPDGIYLGNTLDTGDYIKYNFFYGKDGITNPMSIIFGKKGSGKSVLEQLIGLRSAANNEWVYYFDIEGEYEESVDKQGGDIVRVRPGEKTGINPMDLNETFDENTGERYVDIHEKVSDIRSNLNVFVSKYRLSKPYLDGKEITILEEVCRHLYTSRDITSDPDSLYEEKPDEKIDDDTYVLSKVKKKMPIFSDLRDELYKHDATNELADLMKIITGDGSLSIFDCHTTIDLKDGRPTCFSFKGLKDDFAKLYSILSIMDFLWSVLGKWEYADIKKKILMDEVWFFLIMVAVITKMENFIRRGRKYLISLIMATHLIYDFIKSISKSASNGESSAKSLLDLCETKFILGNTPEVVSEIVDYFKLPPGLKGEISSFKEGQCILLNSQMRTAMKVKLFDFEKDYMKSKSKKAV